MARTADYRERDSFAGSKPEAMERRIYYGMCVAVVLTVLLSSVLMPWRVTTGLLIGGALSLLNHNWLRGSVMAAMGEASKVKKVQVSRFVLRYFVVVTAIAAAYLLNLASIVAMLFGLCTFVVAALVEAFAQTLFVIFHREGI